MCSFESLSREELRQELVSRHIYDFPPINKKRMTDILKDNLCGVQRVPALLLLNPTADLWEMNLLNYTVLPFEPLHDLKGHIANLLNVNVIYLNAYGTNTELPTRVRTASFRGSIKGAVVPTSKS